jgi:ABC-type transporter Mla MlaB component
MLRVTTQTDNEKTTLQLEGKLTNPWTEELYRCWREVPRTHRNHVLVDLREVTFIDSDGKALLAQMWKQGARFHTTGCFNTIIVEEITGCGRRDACDR